MHILRNIRSKIWACVSVALLSYLIATLATTWVNNETKVSITHIQKIDLPLSSKGLLVHSLFNAQSEDYENGLLTGEKGDVLRANMRHDQIALMLEELVQLASASHNDIYPRILSLRDDYNDYFIMASHYYLEAVQKADIFAARKEVHQLGKLRAGLDADFQNVAEMLQAMIVTDLGDNNQRIDLYTRLLHILFVLFLLLTTIVINWLANKEIIAPLANVKKMINDFSRGRTVDKPPRSQGGDEIQALASSFWQMTRELQHITVSRDYVDNIINNMSDSLVILNPDLTIQTANHATLSLLHSSEEDLEGSSFRKIFSHKEESVADSLFQGLIEGKAVTNLEALYISAEDDAIPVLFSASALYLPDGSLQGISCLAHDISELKEQRDQLEFLANFDKLTGLPNRNLFFDRLILTMNEARRYGHLFALFYLDLDHFKPLNDKYGHEAGDLALQEVAKRMQGTVRDTDTVSRVGGDEFTILLSRVHNASDAMKVATKVLDAIGKPFVIHGNQCVLGVSIGICLSSPDLTSADILMKNADTAMYAAKAQGRNRFMFSSPDQM
ncbi:MAG: sensor domain-containing diguanylate cyclase [Proteobacteria bacterium]|nr:sensor domain-containing diguanylate cyclase [Pseudomonadota bacterium]MBU1639607.1 sensor domain-containing diguanylate cyclase [Pseudomonadota bacterium]